MGVMVLITKECFKDKGKQSPFVDRHCKSRHAGLVYKLRKTNNQNLIHHLPVRMSFEIFIFLKIEGKNNNPCPCRLGSAWNFLLVHTSKLQSHFKEKKA